METLKWLFLLAGLPAGKTVLYNFKKISQKCAKFKNLPVLIKTKSRCKRLENYLQVYIYCKNLSWEMNVLVGKAFIWHSDGT